MKIGVFIATTVKSGGTYQYCLIFLNALEKSKLQGKFILLSPKDSFKKEKTILKKSGKWQFVNLDLKKLNPKKIKFFRLRQTLGRIYDDFLKPVLNLEIKKTVDSKKHKLDLILYPVPHLSCFQQKIPYLVCVHDLQHRISHRFPEVSQKGEWRKREFLYKNALKHASAIIAESKMGKKYIQKFYNINSKKITVLPYLPPPHIKQSVAPKFLEKIRNKYQLPSKYIFYPAQFWPHKNHMKIIKALAILKNEGLKVDAVFVGNKMNQWGEYERVMKKARQLKVKNQIKHFGYIGNKEMVAFYKMATCLVMPTFFGPSNIPPLEAFFLGCPVITSDIKGVREQANKAAILINPKSEKALAAAILQIYRQPKLRNKLKKEGYKKIKSWTEKDFGEKLEKIIKKTKREIHD